MQDNALLGITSHIFSRHVSEAGIEKCSKNDGIGILESDQTDAEVARKSAPNENRG